MKSEIEIGDNWLRMTRVFDASRTFVFEWWTQAEKMQQWHGCKGSTGCEIVADFRVGGSFTHKMQIEGKGEFSFTGTYDEIVAPERVVYHANFGPLTTRVVLEFFEHGRGTKMVLTHEGLPNESFCKNISQGSDEGFDKFDELIRNQAQLPPL